MALPDADSLLSLHPRLVLSFLLIMGTPASPPPGTCLLMPLSKFRYPQTHRRHWVPASYILCDAAWTQCTLNNNSHWHENGTFELTILQDLNTFCRHNSKWSEGPYIQAFCSLCSQVALCLSGLAVHTLLLPAEDSQPNPSACAVSSSDPAAPPRPPCNPL